MLRFYLRRFLIGLWRFLKISKKEIPLEVAEATLDKIVEHLNPLCTRIEVAGSIRRRRPMVHDIDLVVIPKYFMWGGAIPSILIKKLGAKLTKNGALIKQFTIDDIQVDLIKATQRNWGIRMLRWTGSAAHNIRLCTQAKKLGMQLAVSQGLLSKEGELLEAASEHKIFFLLELDYVAPEDREVNR